MEEDGDGVPPNDVRRILLEQDGTWSLRLRLDGPDRAGAMRALRAVGLSYPDLARLLKSGDDYVFEGTRCEVDLLQHRLKAEGVTSFRLEPVPAKTP